MEKESLEKPRSKEEGMEKSKKPEETEKTIEEKIRKIEESGPDVSINIHLLLNVMEDIKYLADNYAKSDLEKAHEFNKLLQEVTDKAIQELERGKKKLAK